MKQAAIFFILLSGIILFAVSCKNKIDTTPVDKELFSNINENGFTYYDGTPGITAGLGDSPHGYERVRFNSIAYAALINGKLPEDSTFPAGSVIVKEIYSGANGSIVQYSIMKKESSSLAGNGYLWAEYDKDGKPTFSAANKGDGCISCHSGSANRDMIRSFDLH